jgi:hypothetical protein
MNSIIRASEIWLDEPTASPRTLKVLTNASVVPVLPGLSTGVKQDWSKATAISMVRVAKIEPLSGSHYTLSSQPAVCPISRYEVNAR